MKSKNPIFRSPPGLRFRSNAANLCCLLVSATAAGAAVPWGTNLVVNGSGASDLSTGWTVISNLGSGWTRVATGGYDDVPGYFQTSYGWCTRSQTINLLASGATAAELDAAPAIQIGEAISSYLQGAMDRYYIKVELRDENQTVIASWNAGTQAAGIQVGSAWVQESYEFTNYGPGVRYVYFEDGGIDSGFWAGQYGTTHDGVFVKFRNAALEVDTDGDLIPDVWETANGLNPGLDDAAGDSDSDGLVNLDEYKAGTNPQAPDTDSDGLLDAWEYQNGTQGAVADATADPDADGLTNLQEFNAGLHAAKWDTDGDLVSDSTEIRLGTEPNDGGSVPVFDWKPLMSENFDDPGVASVYQFQSISGAYTGGLIDTGIDPGKNGARLTDAATADTRNLLVWDGVDARADAVRLSFDFRMSPDIGNLAADGFGVGLMLASQWGTTGPVVSDALATYAWEDPTAAPGIPEALFAGFDVYNGGTNDIRMTGPEKATVSLGDVSDIEMGGFILNNGAFHRAILTVTSVGPDASSAKLELIPNVATAGAQVAAIHDVLVKGFNLRGEQFRLIAGGRTGGLTVSTDIDNVLIEVAGAVSPPVEPTAPVITSVGVTAEGVALSWSSAPGARYAVEYTDEFTGWETAATDLTSGGASTSYTHALAVPRPERRFYRVRRLP